MKTKILVSIEHHFVRCPDGVYTDLAFGYDYWQEQLDVFDEVIVLARVRKSESIPEEMFRSDGDGVSFLDLYDYKGFFSLLIWWPLVFIQCKKALKITDNYLLRGGFVSILLWVWLKIYRRDYAMEYVTRVIEGISTEGKGFYKAFYRIIGIVLEYICCLQARGAKQASYTSNYLSRHYPTKDKSSCFVFSGVRISDEVITAPRDLASFNKNPFVIVSIGRMELQKGHEWLVRTAVELSQRRDIPDWLINLVGPGSQVEPLRKLVKACNLEGKVNVLGGVKWGVELFKYIDNAHLFVLPSLTESMPRALIEGMARGIPAIGSNVGGIPELLPEEDLVPVSNAKMLTVKIVDCMMDVDRLIAMSARNYERALDYKIEKTKMKKLAFWESIKSNKQYAI